MAGTIYCIDTSSLLVWYVDTYPPAIFERLPTKMEELVAAGRLRSPKACFTEIKSDNCQKWAKAQADLFVEEAAEVQLAVKAIMAAHFNPQKPHKGISGADPFVVAMAKAGGRTGR